MVLVLGRRIRSFKRAGESIDLLNFGLLRDGNVSEKEEKKNKKKRVKMCTSLPRQWPPVEGARSQDLVRRSTISDFNGGSTPRKSMASTSPRLVVGGLDSSPRAPCEDDPLASPKASWATGSSDTPREGDRSTLTLLDGGSQVLRGVGVDAAVTSSPSFGCERLHIANYGRLRETTGGFRPRNMTFSTY
ncbi:hypothetical protein Cgig2_032961 [Carnegiea gigantea]|uniref:Uncharacterized protein n=1 Tax=Carnegiea gigantea TaxID=171969 RepID=A0A9Q1GHM9_9CARY|nr:hypothetical protein Cgig2_032961 [Carnegiea gigantea]